MEEKKKNKLVPAIIIILLAIVIAGLGIVIYALTRPEEAPDRGNKVGLVVGNDAPQIDERDANFTTQMNMEWVFPTGDAPSINAEVGNNELNKRACYFDVYLSDKPSEIIYTSPVMPVGTKLEELKLDKPLPKGEYEAKCDYHLLDDNNNETTNVVFDVSIIILE